MNDNSSKRGGWARMRVWENTHILLWLIKDTCWALEFKPGGIVMIIPTVFMAVYLAAKSAGNRSELMHNIAVCCWILANSVWMLGEFFGYETRGYAVVLFCMGLSAIAFYYIFWYKRDSRL